MSSQYHFTWGQTVNGACQQFTEFADSQAERTPHCPVGYTQDEYGTQCYRVKPEACPFCNPIQGAGGQKLQTETDIAAAPGALGLTRYYSSTGFYTSPGVNRPFEILGPHWHHSWQSSVVVELATSAGSDSYAFVTLPSGDYLQFYQSGTTWVGRQDKTGTLTELTSNGVRTGWQFTASDDAIYQYDANGVWTSVDRHGRVTSLHYSDSTTPLSVAPKPGLLTEVVDPQGRSLSFFYDNYSYLVRVVDTSGAVLAYRYASRVVAGITENQGLLEYVDKPGGGTRQYLYDETAYVTANLPYHQLLTGIVDENNQRLATYEYDASGRAYHEWHGSGDADSTTLYYNSNGYNGATSNTIQATTSGAFERRNFVNVAGIVRDAGVDHCSDSTCSTVVAHSSRNYDAAGNPYTDKDFNGNVTQHTYNTRGLERQRVEAVGTLQQRTIITQWNPNFNVPDSRSVGVGDVGSANWVTESLTNWAYNSRGQATARCDTDPADSVAMAYTCSDTIAPPAGAKVRRTVTAYCEDAYVCGGVGLVLSIDGPRTDVSDVTAYGYYLSDDPSCTTTPALCSHRKGDLWKITNARGQVTTYVSYDPNGRVTRQQDANGVYTDMTYSPRGWLLTRTVRANADGTTNSLLDATTRFGYDNVGNVTSIVQPDGTAMEYVYDAAHRLTDIYDSQNIKKYTTNSDHIQYTLDAAGNRKAESTYDPTGALKRALTRQYDQLNQLVAVLNGSTPSVVVEQFQNPPLPESPPPGTTDGYDGNGNAIYSVDANGVGTEQQYDPLNRLKASLQDHAGTTTTKDTTTQYAYDARDNLRSVTDPDNLVTYYTYDGLNNLTQLQSPDTGTTTYGTITQPGYDAAGNRLMQTDANGITTTYSYDALNRLTGITYPTTSLNVTYAYDVPTPSCYNIGRLTQITDSSGSTTYCYDPRGNVLTKTQVTGGTTFTTSYAYNLADRVLTITYPSGAIVTYVRDTVGRIKSIKYQANATATALTILNNVSYYPFGPANVLTFGNGRTLTKTYDQNYAIGTISSSDPNGLAITAMVDPLGNLTHASNGANPPSQSYSYDAIYRLTGVTDSSNNTVEAYTYGLTGDRLSKTYQVQSSTYAYTSPLTSHQLQGIDGVTRAYDPDGNTTAPSSGQLPAFTYDDRNRLSYVHISNTPESCMGRICNPGSDAAVSYDYNGRGERVHKNLAYSGLYGVRVDETAYLYSEEGKLLGQYPIRGNDTQAEYIYLDGTPIAYVTNGQIYYIETDQLGTPRDVVKPGTPDTIVWKWDYFGSAFGENAPSVQTTTFNLRFPGQYYDAETGLNYNYFRDYEPGTGRYVESDPTGLDGGISTYAYVNNNPVIDFDETGLAPGGPYHPPEGTRLKCTGDDSCTMLKGKMWVLMRMIASHQLWDWINPPPRGGGRHANEIADLWRAYANCQALHAKKCEGNCPPRAPEVPVVPLPGLPMTPTVPVEPMMPLEPILIP